MPGLVEDFSNETDGSRLRPRLRLVAVEHLAEGDVVERRVFPDMRTSGSDVIRVFGDVGADASVGKVDRIEGRFSRCRILF